MRGSLALLSVLLVALTLPGQASATPTVALGDGLVIPVASECSSPPCGWIDPIIDLQFSGKPPCGGFGGLTAAERPTDCLPVPTVDEPVVLEGKFLWYWEVSNDGTYPMDPNEDIRVSFAGAAANPSWIGMEASPSEFVITMQDLVSMDHYVVDDSDPSAIRIWFHYEEPVTVTFTRTGEPDAADLDRLSERNMIQNFFIKVRSTASGDRYKEAFGIEEVRFDTCADESICTQSVSSASKGIPALGLLLVVGSLMAVAVVVVRRQRA